MKKVVVIHCLLLMISGCVQHQYVYLERKPNSVLPYDVSVGDTVKVITKEAQSVEFKITQITDDSLIGDNIVIRFENIWRLHLKEVDTPTTVVMTSGVSALFIVLGFVGLALVTL